ncbi:hypothetical protein [Larkinella rosea]|uniref:Secretion system C-terminal sorting domain-containing protein n=1 Tax=Larkinella rosea TaxID=2025312 RepID=A0A3P1BNJ4_9BACT|nr:hypothetical protein [Larkinella rosea]RRB02667.1 hypothetical protein EHT25_19670 [Larkinella rosea]
MKTLIKSLFVAFSLTLVSFSVSNADINKPIGRPKNAVSFQRGIYTTSEGKLQIALNKQTGGTVEIRLVDQKGNEVFFQKIGKRQQAVRLRLDVSSLTDGDYQVVITNGFDTTVNDLTIATKPAHVANRMIAVN